jgi:drug/metabolite transporter (DMT)-like permease
MSPALVPLILTIVGGAVYHLSQKAIGGGHPWSVLTVAYGIAFAASAMFWWVLPGRAAGMRPAEIGLAATIGLGAFAIEAGFFLAYRAGWPVGTTALLSNAIVTVVLAAVGAAVFGEGLSLTRAGGAVLAVAGAWLLARG